MLVMVILKGLSIGLTGVYRLPISSRKDSLYATPSAINYFILFEVMLVALTALMGMKRIWSSVKPIFIR